MATSKGSIKNVALTGATGALGSQILTALLESGEFKVTVVARRTNFTIPSGVTVKIADFDSVASLTEAFQGQDAVIDSTSGPDPTKNIAVVDAAICAGVTRIIPGEYAVSVEDTRAREIPVFQGKEKTLRHIRKLAKEGKIEYATISTGVFLDWSLENGFINIDVFNKKIHLMNGGGLVNPLTLLQSVAKATVQALRLDSPLNRSFHIYSVRKTQKEMADLAKEALGSDGWETTTPDMEKALEGALSEFKAGNINGQVVGDMVRYVSSTIGDFSPWEKDDNAILGVPVMSDKEVIQLIQKIAGTKK